MEWIQQNPGHFLFYLVMAGAILLITINARKSRRRYLANLAGDNKQILCASCGNAYQEGNYYKIRSLNYCPVCFSRMFKNTKLGLGFFIGMMILGLLLATLGISQDYSRGVLTKEDFINFIKMFLRFMVLPCGFIIWWIYREFNILRKAKQSKRQMTMN